MNKSNIMNFAIRFLVVGVLATINMSAFAQNDVLDQYKDYKEIYRDTTLYEAPTETWVQRDSLYDPLRVVTNKFGKNWFLFATGGVHSFRGDYSNLGKFSGTLSPDFGIGFGKWFTPGIAIKAEVIKSNSKGYTAYENGHYGYGDPIYDDEGNFKYRKMKTGWWDYSISALFNLSRLFLGYEGYDSNKRMNQFMVSAGLGGVHHTGYSHSYSSDNELSAHAEFQYSRFFTTKKRVSLDLKARWIFYQSNFDLEYGQADYVAEKVDHNFGLNIGFTFYLGSKRSNGWGQSTTAFYQRDYREQKVVVVREKEQPKIEYGTLTFYVFYPNNYSGRNDAPLIASAPVNTLDYLAGGIFTQKRYVNNGTVSSYLALGKSLNGLAVEDLPTEPANHNFDIDYVPRGYEMQISRPLSLSLLPDSMTTFREKAGFYYAPIYDGQHVWQYRVDNATLGQQLLSTENYAETESFGLNAHHGLNIIRQQMNLDTNDLLVSFADVYAAMRSNEGYISQFADKQTVDEVRRVLDNGVITMIQAEGLATSQDNYTGANAAQVGTDRNTALSQNRANTVITWLKGNEHLSDATSQIYLVNSMEGPIRTVKDASTRGLNAKLNRCVKVRIHYMMK